MAAKRRKAPKKKERKPAKPAAAKKKPAAAKSVDAGEEKPGMPIESAVVLATTLMLLAGIVLVDYVKGRDYGEGILFKNKYEATASE